MVEPTFQPNVATVQQRWTDPNTLPMGLSFGNTGDIHQHAIGPLGVDVDNDGTVDVVITPEELRQFIMERGHRVQADAGTSRAAAAGALPASSQLLAGSAGVGSSATGSSANWPHGRVLQSPRSAISFGAGSPEEFGSTRIPSSSTRLGARPAAVAGGATRPAALAEGGHQPARPARMVSPSAASGRSGGIGSSSSLASMPFSAGVLPQRVLPPAGSLPRSQPRSPVPPLVLPGTQSQRSSAGPSPPSAGPGPPRSGGRWKWAPGPPGSGQRPPSAPSITSRPRSRSASPAPGRAGSGRSATPPSGHYPPSMPGGSTPGGQTPAAYHDAPRPAPPEPPGPEPFGAPQFPSTATFPAGQPPPFSGALRRPGPAAPETSAPVYPPGQPPLQGGVQYAGLAGPGDAYRNELRAPSTAEHAYPPDQPALQGGPHTGPAEYAPVYRSAAAAYPPDSPSMPSMPGSTQFAYARPVVDYAAAPREPPGTAGPPGQHGSIPYAAPADYAPRTRPAADASDRPAPAALPAASTQPAARGRGPDRATSARSATPVSAHSPPTPPLGGPAHDGAFGAGGPPQPAFAAEEVQTGGLEGHAQASHVVDPHRAWPGMPGILPPMNQVRDRVGVWLGAKPRSAGVLPPGPPESVGPADFAPRSGQGSTTPAAPAHGPGQLGQPPQGGGQQAAADYAQRTVPFPPAWPAQGGVPGSAAPGGLDHRPPTPGAMANPGGPADPQMAVHYQQVHQHFHQHAGGTHIHQQPQLVSGHVVYGGVQGGDTHITQHYSTTQQNNQTTQQNYNVTQNVNATQNFNTTLSTQNFNATQNYNVTQNPQTMQPPGSVGDRPVIERIVEVDRPLITERVTVVEKPVDRIVEVEKIVEKPIYIKETQPIYMTQNIEKVVLKQPVEVVTRRLRAHEVQGDYEFPYHDPMPELGCDFVGHVLPATSWNAWLGGK